MICVYLPCDNMSKNEIDTVYSDCIDTIEKVMNMTDCNATIICGDLNTDLSRVTAHTNYLKHFVSNHTLKFCWDSTCAVKDYTFENHNGIGISTIDHFICSSNIFSQVNEMYVINHALNPSNHRPIILSYKDECFRVKNFTTIRKNTRPTWDKASSQQIKKYKEKLDFIIGKNNFKHMFQYCTDKKCQRKDHLRAINTLCDTIVEGCLDAEAQCIPKSRPKQGN